MRDRFETACGIFVKNNKVLLGKRPLSKDNYPGLWDIPAGHLEKDETVEQALFREMKEELGVEVSDFEKFISYEEIDLFSKRKYTHNIFIIKKWAGEITYFNEMDEFNWFSFNELKKLEKTFSNEMIEPLFN